VLDILYNMSADAYAKLVAHNNTVVQQFKTYKEAQERALAEAYSRLAALKEFCAKEREAFELEKQALLLEKDRALEKQALAFEQEKRELRDGFEQEKRALRDAFETEKRALEKQKQSVGAVVKNQLVNKALADFFNSA
jgi:hypothetical protein